MIRALIIDLDGTLVDSAPSIALALAAQRALRGAPASVDLEVVRRLVSRGARELVRMSLRNCERDTEADLAEFRNIYAGIRTPPESVYPGVAAALAELKARNISLAVCTNKPQQLTERVLEDTELAPFFGAVVGGDAVLHCKPHPDHVLRTAAALGRNPAEAVYLGDSVIDARAARAAGVPFWLAAYGYGDTELATDLAVYPPDELVSAFNELPALVWRHLKNALASG